MSIAATAAPPLAIQRRHDLDAERIPFRGRYYWNVRDPLSLRYFQFRDEEYFVLSQLDGNTSLETIQERFHQRFAPRRIELPQLNWFLGMLHRESLVVADAPDQGARLLDRQRRWQRQQRWSQLSNPLAIRFRGVNPERFFTAICPVCRWLFSAVTVAAGFALMLLALGWALLHAERLVSRLPSITTFFHVDNFFWLAVALFVTKVAHEFAHGLACHHFGGRCRELGIMLLVFTPCLYCNVSDAWLMRGKWSRIAVSAAGIYVELIIASLALFLWWFSAPGVFHAVCLNLVVVCSLGTILFNGNPFLRYDGYFIFADLIEIPNLREQAAAMLRRPFLVLLTKQAPLESPLATRDRPLLLAGYAFASLAYRWMLISTILWLVYSVLSAHRLQLVAQAFLVIVFAGMLVAPGWRSIQFLRDPRRRRTLRTGRAGVLVVAVLAAIVAALFVPLPCHVRGPTILEPAGATNVYVEVPGILEEAIDAGAHVQAGAVIARLKNAELEADLVRLRGDRDLQQLIVQNLQRQQLHDSRGGISGAGGQLPSALDALADLDEQLHQRVQQAERLRARSPVAGTVIPPRSKLGQQANPDSLESWSGSPLDLRNRGCYLERSTPVAWIATSKDVESVVLVREDDIRLVEVGQSVKIRFESLPSSDLTGSVVEISPSDQESLPPELLAEGMIPVARDGLDAHAAQTWYELRVDVDDAERLPPLRSVGRARIHVTDRSLALRLADYFRRTFEVF